MIDFEIPSRRGDRFEKDRGGILSQIRGVFSMAVSYI